MSVFVRIYKEMMKSGLLRKLGAERFETLVVLAFHMKPNGRCYPPQDDLAKIMGIGRQAANRRIKSLLAFRFDNKPIVELVTDEEIDRRNNVYRVLPISQVAIFEGEVEPLNMSPQNDTLNNTSREHDINMSSKHDTSKENMSRQHDTNNKKTNNKDNNIKDSNEPSNQSTVETFKNASDVVKYFLKKYRETYDVEYSVSWKSDPAKVKSKLLNSYSMTQIKDIIDLTFEQYDRTWATQGYPRPTIGQLCTWIPNKALAILQAREKKQADIKKAMEAPRPSMEDLLARMERGLG